MTLTELRYIVTLSQVQHFGQAAERCNVSQPTLSIAVKKLESELGIDVFERSKNSVRLTPVGEKIVAPSQRVPGAVHGGRGQCCGRTRAPWRCRVVVTGLCQF